MPISWIVIKVFIDSNNPALSFGIVLGLLSCSQTRVDYETHLSNLLILQSILAAGIFPIWIAIHERDIFFSHDELHSSLGIFHSSDFPVSSTKMCTSISFRIVSFWYRCMYVSLILNANCVTISSITISSVQSCIHLFLLNPIDNPSIFSMKLCSLMTPFWYYYIATECIYTYLQVFRVALLTVLWSGTRALTRIGFQLWAGKLANFY